MEGSTTEGAFSLLLRLDRLARAPEAQRLRETVWAIAAAGCEKLFIDWGRSYPWGFGERAHRDPPYREEFVPGLVREAELRGMALFPVLPEPAELGMIARAGSPRIGRSSRQGEPMPDFSTRERGKLVRDALEVLLALEPYCSRLLVNWRVAPRSETVADVVRDLFAPFGLKLLIRPLGALEESSFLHEVSTVEIRGLEGIVLPAGLLFGPGAEGLSVLREYPIPSVEAGSGGTPPGTSNLPAPASPVGIPVPALSGAVGGVGGLSLLLRE